MDIPPLKPPDPPDGILVSQDVFTSQGDAVNTVETRKHKLPLDNANVSNPDKRHRNVHDIDSSVSMQSIYTHPSFSESRRYTENDCGPFVVHVSRSEPDLAAGSAIRAIKFGQLMYKNGIKNIVKDGVKSVGRNRISVEFNSGSAANDFSCSNFLSSHKFTATIPTYNVTRMGLIRGVPVDLSLDEFIENLELPEKCGKVLKARRLNKKNINNGNVSWTPTQTVVLTFSGQVLPEKVYSFHTAILVQTYQLPTIQCFSCCRFGHVKSLCRSKPRCYRCAQEHTGDSCDILEEASTCLHCSGTHFATSSVCPEQLRQRQIKSVMSQESISYFEASARVANVRRPYSEAVKNVSASQSSSTQSFTSLSPRPSPPTTRTYRKTVTLSPRIRSPQNKGYDKQAHQAIISTPTSSMPNGCALQNPSQSIPQATGNDFLIESLITTLIQIISKFSDAIPPNVAHQLSKLSSLVPLEVHSQNGYDGDGAVSAMEL